MPTYIVPIKRYTLYRPNGQSIEFLNGVLTTEDEEVIKFIEDSVSFKNGLIKKISEAEQIIAELTPKVVRGELTTKELEEQFGVSSEPYACEICGKKAKTISGLLLHKMKSHNIK